MKPLLQHLHDNDHQNCLLFCPPKKTILDQSTSSISVVVIYTFTSYVWLVPSVCLVDITALSTDGDLNEPDVEGATKRVGLCEEH